MVVTCEIEFDQNKYGTYFAGQVLTGKITLKSDKVKQVKGIALKINGGAHTHWSTSTSTTDANGKSSTRTTNYIGQEDYIASLTYLLGSQENQSVNIEPGIHTYNFSCHIPYICPTSFEGCYGRIRYTVTVVLIRPWKFDQTFTQGFTVLKVMDLNYDSPILRVPASSEIYKTFCCGPFRTEPLKLNVSIPQSGYVPGQSIPISVLVSNESNLMVSELKVSLVMLVNCYSQTPIASSITQRTVVNKINGAHPVLRHSKNIFNFVMPVPATPPTCFNVCRIIQIVYQVEVEAMMGWMHANQVVCVPVTIGNVPLMGVLQAQPSMETDMQRQLLNAAALECIDKDEQDTNTTNLTSRVMPENLDEIEVLPSLSSDLTPTYPWSSNDNMPPPSYEEAAHMQRGKINEAHDYGAKDFAPRYPVFDIPSPTAAQPDECDGGYVNGNTGPKSTTWL